MKKKIVIILLLLLNSLTGKANNNTSLNADSTTNEVETLPEIVIENRNTEISNEGVTFLPTTKERKAASDGIQLLRFMNIPFIAIDPTSYRVTSLTGEDVAFFINGISSSLYEVISLLPNEIKTIKYLDNPADAKYLGSKTAIDFIVVEYAYGGYTKFSATHQQPTNRTGAYGYSRFKVKNISYDMNVNGIYETNKHDGETITEVFPNFNLQKDNNTIDSYRKKGMIECEFGIKYNTDTNLISFKIGYGKDMPSVNSNEFFQIYKNTNIDPTLKGSQCNGQKGDRFNCSGQANIQLGRGWNIHLSPSLILSSNKFYSNYLLSDIFNYSYNIAENNYSILIPGGFIKRFQNSKHVILFNFNLNFTQNKDSYAQAVNTETKLRTENEYLCLSYVFQNDHFYITPALSISNYDIIVNNTRHTDTYPIIELETQYAFSRRSALKFWIQYNTLAPSIWTKNEITTNKDNLISIKGNENTKNFKILQPMLTYIWFPSNNFQGIAYLSSIMNFNRIVLDYQKYTESEIIRVPVNSGNYITTTLGLNIKWSILNNSLSFSFIPSLTHISSTGIYKIKQWRPKLGVNFLYYYKNFYFNGNYNLKYADIDMTTGSKSMLPSSYDISAGWSNDSWNISLVLSNFCRFNRRGISINFNSINYKYSKEILSDLYHAGVSLSITYNIRYGKRVSDRGELNGLNRTESAIVH